MYGALRKRAYTSSQIAGLSVAVLVTTLAGYALANGFATDLTRIIERPITFTPMIEDHLPDQPEQRDLPVSDAPPLPIPAPLPPNDLFRTEDTILIEPRAPDVAPVAGPVSTPAPKSVRTRPVLLPQDAPPYPSAAIRHNDQGISKLEICVDARGRVSAANSRRVRGSSPPWAGGGAQCST